MNLGMRPLRLTLFATAVVALGLGAYVAKSGAAQQAEAMRAASVARERSKVVTRVLTYAEQRDKWVSSATKLVAESQRTGITPERWVERKVNLRSAGTTREEADRLVRETTASSVRLFVVEGFELSVLGAKEGLFDVPSTEDRGLVMTLAGSYFAWDAPHDSPGAITALAATPAPKLNKP